MSRPLSVAGVCGGSIHKNSRRQIPTRNALVAHAARRGPLPQQDRVSSSTPTTRGAGAQEASTNVGFILGAGWALMPMAPSGLALYEPQRVQGAVGPGSWPVPSLRGENREEREERLKPSQV